MDLVLLCLLVEYFGLNNHLSPPWISLITYKMSICWVYLTEILLDMCSWGKSYPMVWMPEVALLGLTSRP